MPLAITTVNLPYGQVGSWYQAQLKCNGGAAGPLTWSVLAELGTLPAGLSLNAATGSIEGMPSAVTLPNTRLFIRVQDSAMPMNSDSQLVGLEIGVPPAPDPSNPNLKFSNGDFYEGA
jgi:hypothetical protein